MLVLKPHPAISTVYNVKLLFIKQVPFCVDVVCVIRYCYFYLPALRAVFPHFEALHEPE